MIWDGASPMGGFILPPQDDGYTRACPLTLIGSDWGAVVVGCAERCRGRTVDKHSGN